MRKINRTHKIQHNNVVNDAINTFNIDLNDTSAGTVDYTGGEEVRVNLQKDHSSVKSEAYESLAYGQFTLNKIKHNIADLILAVIMVLILLSTLVFIGVKTFIYIW